MTTLLEARIEAKYFGDKHVLSPLHLSLASGEVVSLVGASGSGKSTLLRILAGLECDFSGRIALNGQALQGRSPEIGFIFQEPRLFPWLTVAQNVSFGLERPSPQALRRASELLVEVGLGGYERALPKQLSGGQAQRVAIARGLFGQPRVLLLDEPFSAVDAFTRMSLQQLLVRVAHQRGVTLLVVTHDIDEAVFLSDRVLVLQANPGAISDTIEVRLPRERERTDPEIGRARTEVFNALHRVHAI
jgi:sulfonate transport system ATP-binding protein